MGLGKRTADAKYIRYEPEGSEVLYDLTESDGNEFVNHANDSACRELLLSMRERLLSRSLQACRTSRTRLHLF